eukprot:scaffold203059_cov32-Tisochrysis_lutea.AAC.2
MRLHVALRSEHREDGCVRDWRANVAKGSAADGRADAVDEVVMLSASNGVRKRSDEGQHDTHGAKGGARGERNHVGEEAYDGGQRPARKTSLRTRQKGDGMERRDDRFPNA